MTALHVESLSAGYGARRVIETLSLPPFQGGAISALIGPNAAGKTTLLRALAGLLPARGTIRLDSTDLLAAGRAHHAAHIAYMPQTLPQGVALTVFEAALSAIKAAPSGEVPIADPRALVMDTLDLLGIAPLAFHTLDRLSGGQRQLASLAQAIVRRPSVLLLDEPTSALDLNYQFRVMDLVRRIVQERGIVAVVVLHDIAMACRWCQRVVMLKDGRIAADGAPGDAVTPDILAQVYGVRARVESCSQGAAQVMVDGLLV